jgi:ubiquinone/menaquinone biosynthesis C-methylase UbiE
MDKMKTQDKNIESVEAFNRLAKLYKENFMEVNLYNDSYDTFCDLVKKPNPKIFEIACGPGNATKYLMSKRPDFKIEAIDLAPNMVRLAADNNPTVSFAVMDCREIEKLNKKFGGIVCGFCMPYLSKEECKKLIRDCAALLENGGIFYFSFIEGDYSDSAYESSSNGQEKCFVYYHGREDFQEILKASRFDLLHQISVPYKRVTGKSENHLIFITKKTDK